MFFKKGRYIVSQISTKTKACRENLKSGAFEEQHNISTSIIHLRFVVANTFYDQSEQVDEKLNIL